MAQSLKRQMIIIASIPLVPAKSVELFNKWQSRLNGAFGPVTLQTTKDQAALNAIGAHISASHQVCQAALEFMREHPALFTDYPEGVKLAQALRNARYLKGEPERA